MRSYCLAQGTRFNIFLITYKGKESEKEYIYIAESLCHIPESTISSVQSLSRVWLFATSWTAVRQPSMSITSSQSLLRFMSIESVDHPTISSCVIPFSCLQSFPESGSFPVSQVLASGSQSIGVSASASVLPMNIQDWFPLGWTRWISLQSKGLWRAFSNTTIQKYQFFGAQLSL